MERHVPVVLATDDPGIMRTTLTEQYRLVALDYPRFRYADLCTFNRNSLEYRFLTGPRSGQTRDTTSIQRRTAGLQKTGST